MRGPGGRRRASALRGAKRGALLKDRRCRGGGRCVGREPGPAAAGAGRRAAGRNRGVLCEAPRVTIVLSLAGFLLQLANTEEYIDGALSGHLGEVLIR